MGSAERAPRLRPAGVAVASGDAAAAGRRLPSLTALRFVAAILVFLCHTTVFRVFADQRLDDRLSLLLVRAGMTGVEFFFVLSGFVLTWSARPGDSARGFWRRRALRIYPNNLVGCALALLGLLATHQVISAALTVPNVFLVQGWWPDLYVVAGINVPSWSLACEVLFYLLFPVLLPLARRIPERLLWPAAGAIVVLVATLPIVARLLPGHPAYADGLSFPQYWFLDVFPVSRLLDFALGIVLALILRAGRWPRPHPAVAVLLVCVGYPITLLAPLRYAVDTTMLVPLALLIGTCADADVRGARSVPRGRVAVWLGEISFAFYTLHYLVLTYVDQALGRRGWPVPIGVAILAAAFAVTVLLAALLYRFVERPVLRRWARSSG